MIMSERIDRDESLGLIDKLRHRLRETLRGKADVCDLALACLLARGHLLIEDPPGLGKTTLAKGLAALVGGRFARIQCTPDLLPTDITGFTLYNQQTRSFGFRPGPVFADVLLADEINRATPRTQSALLEAMAERQVTIDDDCHSTGSRCGSRSARPTGPRNSNCSRRRGAGSGATKPSMR
jgi:MoxR-like ATPase